MSELKVTYIADSTFLFEYGGVRLLTDPWIGTVIYGGAWMQYPLPKIRAEEIGRLDYIFISHIHEDHCDPVTLSKLDRNAQIVTMSRSPNYVESFILRSNFGFKGLLTLKPYVPYKLSDRFSIEIVDANPGHAASYLLDSGLLLHCDGDTVYFANDCVPHKIVFDRLRSCNVKLALLPASGGSSYPQCFENLSSEEKSAERDRIVRSYLDKFATALSTIAPERFMVCAGNHVLSGRQSRLISDSTFLASPTVAYQHAAKTLRSELLAKIVPLRIQEGETWSAKDTYRSTEAWQSACDDGAFASAKAQFLSTVASKQPYDHEGVEFDSTLDMEDVFLRSAENALAKAASMSLIWRSNLYIYLETNNKKSWGLIECEAKRAMIVPNDATKVEPFLSVSCDKRLLFRLFSGQFSWNIADAAAFLSYDRRPNFYDIEAEILLNLVRLPYEAAS